MAVVVCARLAQLGMSQRLEIWLWLLGFRLNPALLLPVSHKSHLGRWRSQRTLGEGHLWSLDPRKSKGFPALPFGRGKRGRSVLPGIFLRSFKTAPCFFFPDLMLLKCLKRLAQESACTLCTLCCFGCSRWFPTATISHTVEEDANQASCSIYWTWWQLFYDSSWQKKWPFVFGRRSLRSSENPVAPSKLALQRWQPKDPKLAPVHIYTGNC